MVCALFLFAHLSPYKPTRKNWSQFAMTTTHALPSSGWLTIENKTALGTVYLLMCRRWFDVASP